MDQEDIQYLENALNNKIAESIETNTNDTVIGMYRGALLTINLLSGHTFRTASDFMGVFENYLQGNYEI